MPSVTPQDDEAVFGEMDVQGTDLVDMHQLAVAFRVMVNQSVISSSFSKSWLRHPLNDIFTTIDVPVVGSRGTVPKLRKARVPGPKLPLCWQGAQCPWRRSGRCFFRHCGAEIDVERPELGGGGGDQG